MRGGKRDGSGRPKLGVRKTITLTLSSGAWNYLIEISNQNQTSISSVIRSLIEENYIDYQHRNTLDNKPDIDWVKLENDLREAMETTRNENDNQNQMKIINFKS